MSGSYIEADKGSPQNAEIKQQNDNLNNYLDQANKYQGNIYRGMSVEGADAESVLAKYKVGSSVDLDSKQSWTKDLSNVNNRLTSVANGQKNPVKITLEYPNSKSGVDVSGQSNFPEESEVIIPKGTSYKVKSIEPHNGGYKITME